MDEITYGSNNGFPEIVPSESLELILPEYENDDGTKNTIFCDRNKELYVESYYPEAHFGQYVWIKEEAGQRKRKVCYKVFRHGVSVGARTSWGGATRLR